MKVTFSISPRRVLQFMGVIIVLLTMTSTVAHMAGFERMFVLNAEANLPTWYASAMLALSAVLLVLIGTAKHQVRAPFAHHWLALALIFTYLSLDESAKIHELGNELDSVLNISNVIPKVWVIPAAVFLSFFALAYGRFVLSLPTNTRRMFVIAAFLFIFGAIGLETLGGYVTNRFTGNTTLYFAVATAEEFLEMAGIALFIYALLAYIGDQWGSMEIQLCIEGKANTTGKSGKSSDPD